MEERLSQKLRRPAFKKESSGVQIPLLPDSLRFPQQTADGRATFAGVYRDLFPQFCQHRGLGASTAEEYDAIMSRQILDFFDNTTAFEVLDEELFRNIWKKILSGKLSEYSRKVAAIVIRGIVETAFQQNRTLTILWGVPEYSGSSGLFRKFSIPQKLKSADEGTLLAEQGIRIRRSISLETEVRLVWNMLDLCDLHGELFAGLIMLTTGARTSEATAFSWKHFCEVAPGYWALVRYDVSNPDSRETEGGGKTANAFRLLPLPQFLAKKLLERKKLLEAHFPGRDLSDFPIACRGECYEIRCTQRELNQRLKYQYQVAGVDEDIMLHAYEDMQTNSDVASDCEASASAYLCRHQFATAMVYCGLSLGEIYTVMGHKEEDEDVKKADFSNPDLFRKLADKMNRRPITQLFDRQCECHTYRYDGIPLRILDDGNVEIRFPEGAAVQMTYLPRESDTLLELHCENFEVSQSTQIILPQNDIEDTISIRSQLFQCAEAAYQKVYKKATSPAKAAAQDDSADIPAAEIASRPPLTRPVMGQARPPLPPFPVPPILSAKLEASEVSLRESTPDKKVPSKPMPAKHAPEVLPQGLPESTHADGSMDVPKDAQKDPPKINKEEPAKGPLPVKHAPRKAAPVSGRQKPPALYLKDDAGTLMALPLPQRQNLNRRGTKIAVSKEFAAPSGILFHDPRLPVLVLSPDGKLFRLPAKIRLHAYCQKHRDAPAVQALLHNGMILQAASASVPPEGAIVCLANTGAVQKVSLAHLQKFSSEGRQLVTLQQGETIVSACLCPKASDVLLLTKHGQALRLTEESLRPAQNPGVKLISGIALRDSDQAISCIPYQSGDEFVIIKQFGHAVRLSADFPLHPHGRNTFGAASVKIQPGDAVLAILPADRAILLLSNSKRSLCFPATEIPLVKNPSGGVITAKLREGESLLAAVTVPNSGDASVNT